jgi:stress-induced morphogen
MAADDIARMIKERFPDAEIRIEDLAGDGDHYAATVVPGPPRQVAGRAAQDN